MHRLQLLCVFLNTDSLEPSKREQQVNGILERKSGNAVLPLGAKAQHDF